MLIIQQALTHPQSETNSHVSKIHVVSNLIKVPFAFKSNSTTSLLSLSLSLSLSNLQSPSQAKKAEHSHSTAQRNATDLRSKPQCASLISWSEVTLSLSLSLLLFGFQAYWKLYSFHYGIESISINFFFNIYMDLSAPFMVSMAFSHYVLNEWSLLSILFSVSDFGFGFGIWSAVFI